MNENVQHAAFRAAAPGRDALDLPSKAVMEQRYHRAGEPVPAYTALARRTVRLEMEKRLGASLTGAHLQLTELRFEGTVYDATSSLGQEQASVIPALLTGDDYEPCHRLMDYVKSLRSVHALLVPSAADPQGTNLVVLHESATDVLTVVRTEAIVVPAEGL